MVRIIEKPLPPLSDPMWREPATRSAPPSIRKVPKEEKGDQQDGAPEKPLASRPPGEPVG
jgi:hypothetical protein